MLDLRGTVLENRGRRQPRPMISTGSASPYVVLSVAGSTISGSASETLDGPRIVRGHDWRGRGSGLIGHGAQAQDERDQGEHVSLEFQIAASQHAHANGVTGQLRQTQPGQSQLQELNVPRSIPERSRTPEMTYRPPRVARAHTPAGVDIVRTERMSPAFTKYHLSDGRALHRFRREEPHATPHDHPWSFETEILAGGYVDEVFHVAPDGTWRSEYVERLPGTVHHVAATHIHRIVGLPHGECWTIVKAGRHRRQTRFWRFGDIVQSRRWNERKWMDHVGRG